MTSETTNAATRIAIPSRILHWLMAPMVIAQLIIGVTMIVSLSYYPLLLAIHRAVGCADPGLRRGAPGEPAHAPAAAVPGHNEPRRAPHRVLVGNLLYALLLVQPLIGWAMLSAARFPIILVGPIHLPGIAPDDIDVYAVLRQAHSVFAFLLFLAFAVQVCAVLFHTLVLRDRLLDRMALWPTRHTAPQPDETAV